MASLSAKAKKAQNPPSSSSWCCFKKREKILSSLCRNFHFDKTSLSGITGKRPRTKLMSALGEEQGRVCLVVLAAFLYAFFAPRLVKMQD